MKEVADNDGNLVGVEDGHLSFGGPRQPIDDPSYAAVQFRLGLPEGRRVEGVPPAPQGEGVVEDGDEIPIHQGPGASMGFLDEGYLTGQSGCHAPGRRFSICVPFQTSPFRQRLPLIPSLTQTFQPGRDVLGGRGNDDLDGRWVAQIPDPVCVPGVDPFALGRVFHGHVNGPYLDQAAQGAVGHDGDAGIGQPADEEHLLGCRRQSVAAMSQAPPSGGTIAPPSGRTVVSEIHASPPYHPALSIRHQARTSAVAPPAR